MSLGFGGCLYCLLTYFSPQFITHLPHVLLYILHIQLTPHFTHTDQPEYVWVGASRQGNGKWVWSAGGMVSERRVELVWEEGAKRWGEVNSVNDIDININIYKLFPYLTHKSY